MLWTFNEIASALSLSSDTLYPHGGVNNITTDGRQYVEQALFIPLKGKQDGHDFIEQAWKNGAVAVLCEKNKTHCVPNGMVVFLVENIIDSLIHLALFARKRTSAKIIAITGSVGKTSTKDMFAKVFLDQGSCTNGNMNNHLGVPLTLLRIPKNISYAVIELGMNHPGEISTLTKLVRPDVAIITNISFAHLEFFSSLEDIASAKAEIFDGLPDSGGIAILPSDSKFFSYLSKKASRHTVYSFGEKYGDAHLIQFNDGIVKAQVLDTQYMYPFGLRAQHMVINSIAVILTLHLLHFNSLHNLSRLGALHNTSGRGNLISIGHWNIIDETYNASPESMHVALKELSTYSGRRIAILGDMQELGPQSLTLHMKLKDDLDGIYVFSIGLHMQLLGKVIDPSFFVCSAYSSTESHFLYQLIHFLQPGDTILIKGSRSMKMESIIHYLEQVANESRDSYPIAQC